jgi:hypothetical protein
LLLKILGRLLHSYLHPLSGGDEFSGDSSTELVLARIREPLIPVFWGKKRKEEKSESKNQITASSSYFKNLKQPVVLMKELVGLSVIWIIPIFQEPWI